MDSKLPRFIQRKIINYYKKKLVNIINKMDPMTIPAEMLYDFARVLYDRVGANNKYNNSTIISPIYVDKVIVGYVIQIRILLDDLIDITGEIDISRSNISNEYLMKLVVHTWSNNSNTSNYHTSLTKFQEVSYNVANELKRHGIYTKYRQTILIKIVDSLYDNIHKFLLEEVNKEERKIS